IKVRFTVSLGAIALDGDGRTSHGDATRPTNDRKAESQKGKLLAHIDALLELIALEQPAKHPTITRQQTGSGVFLVHGRNERWVQEVARFVEQFGLKITILREQPNQGRTVIEKFEDVAADIGFAIVL